MEGDRPSTSDPNALSRARCLEIFVVDPNYAGRRARTRAHERGPRARVCSVVVVVLFWLNSFSRNSIGYVNRYDSYGQSQRSP